LAELSRRALGQHALVRHVDQQRVCGNEQAIRAKADAMELIRKGKQTAAHSPGPEAASAIESTRQKAEQRQKSAQPKTIEDRIEELGGNAKTLQLGIPPENMSWLSQHDQLAMLEGRITLKEAKERSMPE
jgi:K+-sensing histidine kinase KdpD